MVKKWSERSLIIASPDDSFIETLSGELSHLAGKVAGIGSMRFTVKHSEPFRVDLRDDGFSEFSLVSGTPIVARIPRYRYEEYGIKPKKDYEYAYWRKEYAPTAFLRQVEENLAKKYTQYTGEQAETAPIFDKIRFKKQVAVPLRMNGQESTVIGTLWEFYLQPLDDEKR
jgi:CRISPR-associated endoribonuclease Cas6